MKIVEHIPGFVEGFEPRMAEFETLEDLLEVEWVKQWADKDGFRRFSISGDLLMAEVDSPSSWVVGYLSEPVSGLPRWERDRS